MTETAISSQSSPSVCLGFENPHRLMTLLDIMRSFEPDTIFRLCREFIHDSFHCDDGTGYLAEEAKHTMVSRLYFLQNHCERADLPVSCVEIVRDANLMNDSERKIRVEDVQIMASTLCMHLEDECSTKLFFALEADRKKYFNSPTRAYEDAIKHFPEITDDIIESSKCFALGRNAASVFHSTQAIETGMLHLGNFLGVKDPKPGFVATVNELNRIVKTDPQKRSAFESQHFPFIEQMHASVIPLQNAWRHKISHVTGRLTLMTADFSEEVAEEILMATRSFMRRLATEMP